MLQVIVNYFPTSRKYVNIYLSQGKKAMKAPYSWYGVILRFDNLKE